MIQYNDFHLDFFMGLEFERENPLFGVVRWVVPAHTRIYFLCSSNSYICFLVCFPFWLEMRTRGKDDLKIFVYFLCVHTLYIQSPRGGASV